MGIHKRLNLIILEGPPKSGKTALAKQIADLAGLTLTRVQPSDPLGWDDGQSAYLLDMDTVTPDALSWAKRQAGTGIPIIVETRNPLPDFTTPSYRLKEII